MGYKGENNWQEEIQPADTRSCDTALNDLIPSPMPPAQVAITVLFPVRQCPCWLSGLCHGNRTKIPRKEKRKKEKGPK